MTRRHVAIMVGSDDRGRKARTAYGAERAGEPGSRVGVTKPSRAARRARRRR